MNKVALIADIHGNHLMLDYALKLCKKAGVSEYVILGDMITDGPDSKKVLETIKNMKNTHVIRGNREEYMLDYHNGKRPEWNNNFQCETLVKTYESLGASDLQYIDSLPVIKQIDLYGNKALIFHASHIHTKHYITPLKDMDIFLDMYDKYDCTLYLMGHSHVSFSISIGEKHFINPGPLGIPQSVKHYERTDSCSIGILTFDDGKFSYDLIYIPHDPVLMRDYFLKDLHKYDNTFWIKLIADSFITKFYRRSEFFSIVRKICEQEGKQGIDPFPDEIWEKAIKQWKTAHKDTWFY